MENEIIRKPAKLRADTWEKVRKLAKEHKPYPIPTEQQAGLIIEEFFEIRSQDGK